jgi:BMFP domain-containing protein YqiC
MDELTQGDGDLMELARQQMDGRRTGDAPPPATFTTEAIYNEAKSKEAGHAVYTDIDMIEIRVGRDTIRNPVTETDKRTYAAQYLAFKRSESQEAIEGFPLSQWAAIPGKALVKEFAHYGIRSVEQLAAATDSTLALVGPHLNLRQQARDWVANAKSQAPLVKLRQENDAMKSRIEALERMVSRQTQEIEAARQNGGALPAAPAAPVPDARLAALEAQIAALAARQTPSLAVPAPVEAVNGVKLNKDGTPRKKSGPKPKVQEN